MKAFFAKVHTILLFSILFIVAPLTIANASSLTDEVKDVPLNKEWKITFSHPVVQSTVTTNSIYIVDGNGTNLSITPIINGNVVTLPQPNGGYKANQRYTLHITSDVMGQVGSTTKPLTQTIAKPFTTVNSSNEDNYIVVKVNPDGNHSVIGNYETFDLADAHRKQDEAIMYKNEFVKIPHGFAVTNTTSGSVTYFYKSPTFTVGVRYGGLQKKGVELKYLDATKDYVKVNVAGQEMYVKHEDVTLIPSTVAKGASYYIANSTGLWHYIYRHFEGNYVSYLAGEKSSFMQEGVKYYSSDGAKFYDPSGNFVGESYSYFQYLSPRVTTSYSAEQLDDYIMKLLKEKENSGAAKYANATTESGLIGLGKTLKQIEQEKRLNALLILSLAIHESDHGMSCHAQNYNNLFGLNVTDSQSDCDPNNVNKNAAKYFNSIEENISGLVERLNSYYLNVLDMGGYRYNGLALGNKMIGMNVYYATDPYWGAKTAGHMYRLDKAMGGQDYKKHKLGFTSHKDVSVRTEPKVTSTNRAYQYKLDWTIKRIDFMPITLSTTPSNTDGWYRIISEFEHDATDLYTVVENVRLVNTH